MQFEPAAFDSELEFRRGAPINVQEWAVDFLDVNAAILHHLEGVGVLHQAARCLLRVRKWTVLS